MSLHGIAGRSALVTGAGQGIGRAIAERLAAEGARVIANDIDPVAAAATAAAIGGRAAPFDCADRRQVHAALSIAGPVDLCVVNHAFMTMAPFGEEHATDWRRTFDVNLAGCLWVLQASARGMAERGYGRVVCIASEWGLTGWPEASAYAASKGGIVSLVRSAARALGPYGVAVNGIAPGVTATPQLQVDADAAGLSYDEMVAAYAVDVPLGRIGRSQDIAAVCAFLCSEPAGALVGQLLSPNGGSLT